MRKRKNKITIPTLLFIVRSIKIYIYSKSIEKIGLVKKKKIAVKI